jgi:uncharacterized membrane protein YcaP (DUF421 family)
MGKREVGKLSVFDLVVAIMIADLAAIVIENTDWPLMIGVIPIFTLLVTQVALSWITLKSNTLRRWVEGKPTVLIEKGQINDRVMARLRYSMDDLMMQLREKNIFNVADVEFAILETSGKLSVYPKPDKSPVTRKDLNIRTNNKPSLPVPLIIDGKVLDENLEKLGLNRFWLKNKIRERNFKDFKEIAYCSIDANERMFFDRKDR